MTTRTDRQQALVPFNVHEATVHSVQSSILSGEYTCRDVVSAFVAHIEHYNSMINALTCLNPDALAEADKLDAALKAGTHQGLLFGVPILVKDNYDVLGMPTTASCAALLSNFPSSEGSAIRALRREGAIILGKTNMSEMALEGLTVSSLGGQTLNPYDLTRTPGGSSGGTGASVAASFAVFGLGTDTVNSLRSPASANSLYSFRPTRGLISRTGVVPVSKTQDTIGAIGRSLHDIAVALTVMAGVGRDPQDEATLAIPDHTSSIDYSAALARTLAMPQIRVGLMRPFCSQSSSRDDDSVDSATSRVVRQLQTLGVEVVDINDTAAYDPQSLLAMDVQTYELREGLDAYLSTTTGNGPWSMKELYTSPRSNRDFLVIPYLHKFVQKALQSSTSDLDHAARLQDIATLESTLRHSFTSLDLSAIIYPEQRNLVVPVGSPNQFGRNGMLAALTGFPVVTIPIGFSQETEDAPIGVPIGMELLGLPWTEFKLLQIAHAIEVANGSVRRPPMLRDFSRSENGVKSYSQMPRIVPAGISNIDQTAYPVGTIGT